MYFNSCSICVSGSAVDDTTHKCFACSLRFTSLCTSCVSTTCTACVAGNFFDPTTQTCLSCATQYGSGCSACSSITCTTCAGAITTSGNCVSCLIFGTSCTTCSSTSCINCGAGRFIDSSGACQSCVCPVGFTSDVSRCTGTTIGSAALCQTPFTNPTTQAAVTPNAGDNNGYETTPNGLLLDDTTFAQDANSGTGTGTDTSPNKDKHILSGYFTAGFVPGVVKGIEVKIIAKVPTPGTASPQIFASIATAGTFSVGKSTAKLTATESTTTLGSSTDLWGFTSISTTN